MPNMNMNLLSHLHIASTLLLAVFVLFAEASEVEKRQGKCLVTL